MTEPCEAGTRGARARVGGIEMVYDAMGKGTPLLLVHGFPLDRTLWAPQLRALTRRCRVVAPDLGGFGESTGSAPYSMDRWADDLAALLAALAIDRATIAGISMGGYIAFALWRRHRPRVRALVLASTRASGDAEGTRRRRRDTIALARASGAAAVADAMLPSMLGATTHERRPEVVAAAREMMAHAPVEGIVGASEAMLARPDATPTLATIDVPTLIVAGDEDAIVPLDEARVMHAAIAGSRLEILPRAGHLVNLERPAAFNHVLEELVAQIES